MKRRREESPEEEATPETLAKIGEFLAENEVEAFEIALQMPLSSVLSLCRVNSFFSQICESEYFWRRRVLKDFGEKSQLFGQLETNLSNFNI